MSDHDIRTLLRGMAEEVQDVRPLGNKALRRTRTRRLAIATTLVTSVLAIAIGGTGLALTSGVFGEGSSTAPANDPESTPPPPQPMPGTIVAYGATEDGHHWWMSAYQNDAGMLCANLQHDTGDMSDHCEYYDPEGVALGEDPEPGDGPKNLFGWVPDDTAKAWLTNSAEMYMDEGPEDEADEDEDETVASEESPDGDASGDAPGPNIEIRGDEEVRLFDAPEGFPFPVKFYAVVPGMADARAFRIELKNGDASVILFANPSPSQEASQDSSHRRVFIAEGEQGGHSWELYERMRGDNRCLDLVWDDGDFGSGGTCSTAVPRAESFQYSMLSTGGAEDSPIAFFAAMTREVASMELTLDDGRTLEPEIIEGPEGTETNYAVLTWPASDGPVTGDVTTRDEDGNVLDTMELCGVGGASFTGGKGVSDVGGTSMGCGSDSPPR